MMNFIFKKSTNETSKQIVSSVRDMLAVDSSAAIDKGKIIGILSLTELLIHNLAGKPPTFFISNYNKITSITSILRPSLIEHVRNEIDIVKRESKPIEAQRVSYYNEVLYHLVGECQFTEGVDKEISYFGHKFFGIVLQA